MQQMKQCLQMEVEKFKNNFLTYNLGDAFDVDCVKFKRGERRIIVLYIPKTVATNENRNCVTDARFAKFRAEKAWCVAIVFVPKFSIRESETPILVQTENTYQHSFEDATLEYKINQWIYPHVWEPDANKICAPGIHFFNHWLPAFCYRIDIQSELCVLFKDGGSIQAVRLRPSSEWIFKKTEIQKHMHTRFDIVV